MTTPTDSSAAAAGDPVQETRSHLEQALAALDQLHKVLPPVSTRFSSSAGGGEPS